MSTTMIKPLKKLTYDFVLTKLSELPTLPTIIAEISELINDPMVSTGEVVKLIETDQSISTKLLRLINSGFYAIPGGVKSLDRAVTLLGFDTVFQSVLSTSVITALRGGSAAAFDVKKFWQHSVGAAFIAEALALNLKHKEPHTLFAGALVHDMGKVAMLKIDPEYVLTLAETARSRNKTYEEAEAALSALKHTVIGQMLTQKWNLPFYMQVAVRYHHTFNPAARTGLSLEMNQFADIIVFSNLFAHQIEFGDSGHSIALPFPEDLLTRLSIKEDNWPSLKKAIELNLEKSKSFLEIIGAEDK